MVRTKKTTTETEETKTEESVVETTKESLKSVEKTITEPVQLAPIQGNYCPNCNQKLLTDLEGQPLCPEQLKQCPRYNGG